MILHLFGNSKYFGVILIGGRLLDRGRLLDKRRLFGSVGVY